MNDAEVYSAPEQIVEEMLALEIDAENEEPATSAVQLTHRNWNHGSTQTSDDMYLGGLMCE